MHEMSELVKEWHAKTVVLSLYCYSPVWWHILGVSD